MAITQEENPTFERIYERPIPEWYWRHSQSIPDSKTFHEHLYGKDFQYEQFAELFSAELVDPESWCELFANSGAKYVVTTANYHDGFARWPTEYSNTFHTNPER